MVDTDQLLKKLQENNLTHWKKAPEGYWNGTGLNKLESCAYYAVLSSLSKEELSEILPVVKNWPLSSNIVERIKKTLNPEPYNPIKRNENVDTILKRFLDKKSKRVVESRKELKKRFEYLDFKDQKKIINAFLESPNSNDVEWGGYQAGLHWDECFIGPLTKAFERELYLDVIITIIRHFPIEFVKQHEEVLASRDKEDLCIRLGNEPGFSLDKYDLYIFEYLYILATLKREVPESEEEIEKRVFLFIYKQVVREDSGYSFGWGFSFTDFPELRKMIWALGQLKMPNIVLKILDCQAYILANKTEGTNAESIWLARKWIEEVWDYEGKEDLLNHLVMIDGWNVVDYRDCEDLPPDVIDFWNNGFTQFDEFTPSFDPFEY